MSLPWFDYKNSDFHLTRRPSPLLALMKQVAMLRPMARNWGKSLANSHLRAEALSPTAQKETNLDNNHVSQLGSGSFLSWAFRWALNPGKQIDWSFVKKPEAGTQLSYAQISDYRNYEIKKVCCFKLLNFVVICYAVINK